MIRIAFNIDTNVATLSTTAIKLNADVPVLLTFNQAPGEVGYVQLALGDDADSPALLAFTQDFVEESATRRAATLDTRDERLITFMDGKGPTSVNVELALLLDGKRIVCPNLAITVQQSLIPPGPLPGTPMGTGEGTPMGTGEGTPMGTGE